MYKIITITGMLFLVATTSFSQKTRSEVNKEANEIYNTKSKVERFDLTTLLTEEQKEEQQRAREEKKLHISLYLDTVSISKSLRAKLRNDLNENPFSARFQKFMVRYKKEFVLLKSSEDKLAQQEFESKGKG